MYRLVLEWANEHRDELRENWELAERHEPLNPIAPLEQPLMQSIVSVIPLEGYQLEVRFDDGTAGRIALEDRLFGPIFEPLRDVALFNQVTVDEFGAICWPNGADLAPDALYVRLRAASVSV